MSISLSGRASRANTASRIKVSVLCAALVVLTIACAEKEVILPGERISIRSGSDTAQDGAQDTTQGGAQDGVTVAAQTAARTTPLRLPTAVNSADWTHKNGSATHSMGHRALSANPQLVWSADIGQGNGKRQRLTADPIVAGGRIFTQDAAALVRAFDLAGNVLWSRDLTPASDDIGQASGGGLVFGGGRVFATTGYGEVIALDAAQGGVIWRHKMGAAIASAPVIAGDNLIVVARNNVAQSLSQRFGRIQWQQNSSGEDPGLTGAGTPATAGRIAVLPFTSGEVVASLLVNGQRIWGTAVTGSRVELARAGVTDISGDPVIDGNTIYAANQAGRLVAVDRRDGSRKWTAQEGSYNPVVPIAGSVFVLTDKAALMRLSAADGSEIWSADLAEYIPVRRKRRGIRDAYVYYGPVVAGGRVLVAGSDGVMRAYDPQSGAPVGQFEIPGGAGSHVALAGGRLYIVSADGRLHAYQ